MIALTPLGYYLPNNLPGHKRGLQCSYPNAKEREQYIFRNGMDHPTPVR